MFTKAVKRIVSLSLSFIMALVFTIGVLPQEKVRSATFSDINTSTMFFKQNTSDTCTLASVAMLVRRAALLNGSSSWTEVTESNLQSTAWLSGTGLLNSFTYAGISVSSAKISSNQTQTMINLLTSHPEGIVIYDFEKPHAILLTDYTDGIFYCADPSSKAPAGRIPISQATITVESIDKYWYVTSPSVNIDSEMHLEMQPNEPSISNSVDITFFWNNGPTNISGYNLYIAPVIAGTSNYDWTNARIYCPGYDSTQYSISAGSLIDGAYAAYVEGVDFANDSKTEASNFLYFVIDKNSYTLEPVTLKLDSQSNVIPRNYDVTFSWSKSGVKTSGYNLYVARYDEEKKDYNWENTRIYLPGYESTSHTYPSGYFKEGSYAAYVQAINTEDDITSSQSNFIFFSVSKADYMLETPKISFGDSTNTFKTTNSIVINWTQSGVNASGYNLYIAKYDSELKDYNWDNSRIYISGYFSTSYTVPSGTLKEGRYATYVEAWNTTDDVRSNKSNFLFFTVEDIQTHIHEYVDTVTKRPSCTENGTITYTCACGDSYTEDIVATEHIETTKFARTATCKAEGYTGDVYCQTCGNMLKEGKKIAKKDHTWNAGSITIQPTTSAEGVKTYICQDCGTTKTEAVAKLVVKTVASGKVVKNTASNGIYKVLGDGLSVEFVKPLSKKTFVKIPDVIVIDDVTYKVKGVGANAFKNNTKLTSVTIGRNVTTIGKGSFRGCAKLKTLTMGNNVVSIGDNAFYNCISLKAVIIPAKTKKIGKQAFYGCKKLKTVKVNTKKLINKNVGNKAFAKIDKKAIVKVPSSCMKSYKKLLSKKGLTGKNQKIKK